MWSTEATKTLIETWGDLYIQLNRGSLKQHHWQQVTDAVNRRHADQPLCTDIQAKNRVDTVKKKYKIEKSKVNKSAGKYVSQWPLYNYLDLLIGAPAPATTRRRTPTLMLPPMFSVPVGRRSKRSAPEPELFSGDEDVLRRKFQAMVDAVKMVEEAEGGALRGDGDCDGELGKVAEAIESFGERYERIEREKVGKVIELEKANMQLAIDLNVQMMNYISEELRVKFDRNERVAEAAKNEKESKDAVMVDLGRS